MDSGEFICFRQSPKGLGHVIDTALDEIDALSRVRGRTIDTYMAISALIRNEWGFSDTERERVYSRVKEAEKMLLTKYTIEVEKHLRADYCGELENIPRRDAKMMYLSLALNISGLSQETIELESNPDRRSNLLQLDFNGPSVLTNKQRVYCRKELEKLRTDPLYDIY